MKTCVIATRQYALTYYQNQEEVRWHLRLEKPKKQVSSNIAKNV